MAYSKFNSRKWCLAVCYSVIGSVGLFLGLLDGAEYVAMASTITALYNAANYLGKRYYVDKSS